MIRFDVDIFIYVDLFMEKFFLGQIWKFKRNLISCCVKENNKKS